MIIHDADLEYFPDDIVEMFNCVEEIKIHSSLAHVLLGQKRENVYTRTLLANKTMSSFFSFVNGYQFLMLQLVIN